MRWPYEQAVRAATTGSRRAHHRVFVLLLHQLRLHGRWQLRGQVDVTRQVRLALDRMRLPGHRVLEGERREMRRRRLLAAGRERDRPVDRKPCVIVLGRDREQLERGVLGVLLLPEAAEYVAVR